MPIYEYQCNACKDRHEVIQSISEAPLSQCSKCGGELRKLFSSPAIQFKGSGFYKTDYPSSSSSSGSTSKSGSSTESSSSTESKSESKPETKSESKSETKSESKD
jgi:putative FmdB family regulatory protein